MSLYPKYGVYKILLEISGLKKSVVLSLKPMSLNPKFTVHQYLYIKNTIVLDVFVCPELIGKTTSPRKLKICIQG